ncbi:MAG: putative AlkP superfamily pyrophosphatase or phosphodiesterase [Rhodothermales bacterium]|jgi:predicted AlkP superfamily pyrophosphatase or phosphodiesterase
MRIFLFLFLLAATPVQAQYPKVLLIGIDGIRSDQLAAADTPHIDALGDEGYISLSARTRMPTVSGPGWSSMVTGVWAEKHRVMGNNFAEKRYDLYPDFLTRLEQMDSEWDTFAALDWPPLGTTNADGPLFSDLIDVKVNINGDAMGYGVADERVCDVSESYLASAAVDAAFVYLGNPDVASHDEGLYSAAYKEAIETADDCVGRLVEALNRRAEAEDEDWLILISTDHGRNEGGGHGGDSEAELTIFYVASGASAVPESGVTPHIVDVAVTALTHLGIQILPEWSLDGRPVGISQ